MKSYFAGDYSGGPFLLFGTAHIITLIAIVGVWIVMVLLARRWTLDGRRRMRFGLAALLVCNEVLYHLWVWRIGRWTIDDMLPLHLCAVLVWVGAALLLTRSYRMFEFVYLLGIAGATQALLTPNAAEFGFPHYRYFQTMVSHSSIVLAGLYMAAVEGYRPTPRSIFRVLVGLNLYAVFVGLVNWGLGSNYLYIARKPETASLLDILPRWPWYIPVLEIFAIVLMGILYLPFVRRPGSADALARR